jgi:aspartyl-tRNA(Asn)/glutamyl-tRNA(Gln) amidotransferase subunit C
MPVTIQDVEHVAELARLSFSPAEKARLTEQLNSVLAYMEQLNRLDTTGVEPLAQVVPLENALRDDVRTPGVAREEALRNAPARTEKFFTVPKVLGDR